MYIKITFNRKNDTAAIEKISYGLQKWTRTVSAGLATLYMIKQGPVWEWFDDAAYWEWEDPISAEDLHEWQAASCGMSYNEYIGKPWLD